MKNFTINNLLIAVIALFAGSNVMAAGQTCDQFDYFYADITDNNGVKQTDIYSVSFVGSDAILNALSDIPYGAHIAYNDIEKLLYVVNEDDGSIQTYDPITDDWSVAISPDEALNHITGASISQDGKLLLANQADGVIYIANFSTDPYTVTVYEPGNNISGGDLVFTNTGLFLAAKPSGYFYVVLPGMPNMLLDQVDGNVTGLAKAEDGETVMLSAVGNTSFLQYNIDMGGAAVTQINEYNALLNGEPFTFGNGDMASGCSSTELIVEECSDFRYYYIAMNTPGVAAGTVFQGEIVGNNFVLTELFKTGNKGHMANNEINGDIYVVNGSGTDIKTFDIDGNHIHTASISGLGNGSVALVWHKADGKLYVGNSNKNKVYTLDPVTGDIDLFASNIPVSGGDLISTESDELLLVSRNNNGSSKVYDITTGSPIFLYNVAKSINGAAKTPSGGFIMAEGSGSYKFHTYDADGVPMGVLNSVDSDGNPFRINDGDMASGCIASQPETGDCPNYKLYYMHHPQGGGDKPLLEVTLNNDGTASYTTVVPHFGGHIGITPDGSIIYATSSNKLRTFDVSSASVTANVVIKDAGGTALGGFVAMVVSQDGTIYAGQSSSDQVFIIDPNNGLATPFGPSRPVSGGDLVELDGEIWLINRFFNSFTNVLTGDSFIVPVEQMNGAAVLGNGNVLVADGNGESLMKEIDPSTHEVVATYDIGFPLNGGDLAGVCVGQEPIVVNGSCYATEVVEHIPGTNKNGGSIAANRTDATKALGVPERVDQMVFVSLGYGGSLTLAFDGAIPNGPGDDIEIVETSYNTTSCSAYPEYADVYVSVNGTDWFLAGTVCKFSPYIDISATGEDLDYVNFVKIVNNNTQTTTPDGFDVDGVVALHNCIDEDDVVPPTNPFMAVESNSTLTSFPNPTKGPSKVVFTTGVTTNTLLDVYDMSGRNVATLFNQETQKGKEYKVDFNGSNLPNGVYIYRMTTNNETIVEKFMIAQ